ELGIEGWCMEVRCRGGSKDGVDAKHRASPPPLSGYIRGNGCSPARGSKKNAPCDDHTGRRLCNQCSSSANLPTFCYFAAASSATRSYFGANEPFSFAT